MTSAPPTTQLRIRSLRAEGLGVITLARPELKNALDRQTAVELVAALHELEAAADVRIVIVEGDGDDFCVGVDLHAMAAALDDGIESQLEDARAIGRIFTTVRTMTKPVVAIVRGRALGIGAGVATACDIVLAEETAQFGYPDVRIGFVPALVLPLLRRAVGEKRAAELVLSGRVIGAAEAAQIGLISRCIPSAVFPSEVAAAIEGLVKSSSTALGLTKRLLYRLDDLSFGQEVGIATTTNVEARATADFREAVQRVVDRTGHAS